MASTEPPWVAALGWALLVVVGAVNVLEGDTVTGIGFLIAGCCLTASQVVDDKRPWCGGVLRLLGAAGGALALTGLGIEQF
jgi:hypothetical protein